MLMSLKKKKKFEIGKQTLKENQLSQWRQLSVDSHKNLINPAAL